MINKTQQKVISGSLKMKIFNIPLKIIFTILFMATILNAGTIQAEPIQLDLNLSEKNIWKNFEYHLDKNGKLNFKDLLLASSENKIKWKTPQKEAFSLGYTSSVCWIKFTAENRTGADMKFYLQQAYPLISKINLYIPKKDNRYRMLETGWCYKYSKRAIKHRTFIFPLVLKANSSKTYFLRFQSTGILNVILNIFSQDGFRQYRDNNAPFLWIYYGFFLLMLIYNLMLFLIIRSKSYFYYILNISFFTLFMMSVHGETAQFFLNYSPCITACSIPFFIGMSIFTLIQFSYHYIKIEDQPLLFTKILVKMRTISVIAAISSLLINNYQFSMRLVILIGIFYTIITVVFLIYMTLISKIREAGFLLLAFTPFFTGCMLLFCKSFGFMPANLITNYGIYAGLTFQFLIFSIGLADSLIYMKRKNKKTELKYCNIVESSSDIIFTLDENLKFKTVNKALRKHLGFDEKSVINKSFMKIIHNTQWKKDITLRNILQQYINELKKHKNRISFNTTFKTRFSSEPRDFSVQLEYIKTGDKTEIHGKASIETDNIIYRFILSENQSYQIDNYLGNAEVISQRTTANLHKRLTPAEVTELRIGLREVIINAIEHGNLNIKFEEKTQAINNDTYLGFIHQRQNDPRYRNRKVTVEYSLDYNRVIYTISDEGSGFDHKKTMKSASEKALKEMLTHGRGLIITMQAFDSVKFNKSGNSITLIKYFTPTTNINENISGKKIPENN